MGWHLGEDELTRVLALDVDARYAYAINKISEQGELWTLESEDGWVVGSNPNGVSTIPIWPHEQFAEREASGVWTGTSPAPISLAEDWLTDQRAAWFEKNEVFVAVFMVGTSSMTVDYSTLAELIRGERRERYLRRSSQVARDPKRATRATNDLVSYVSDRDIQMVVQRVPSEFRTRIRDVFRRRSSDAKVLGAVSTMGRRDIDLAARLPIRVSLGRYLHGGQSPEEFGAPKLGQWPPWAVRRFMLYDVLLHEIGHLQIVEPMAKRVERKFASETRAQEFADEMRRTLYSARFDHPDPIHNAPSPGELAMLAVWSRLDKAQRAQLVGLVLSGARPDDAQLSRFEPMTTEQREFVSRVLRAQRLERMRQ
jgi:hypothetical protein